MDIARGLWRNTRNNKREKKIRACIYPKARKPFVMFKPLKYLIIAFALIPLAIMFQSHRIAAAAKAKAYRESPEGRAVAASAEHRQTESRRYHSAKRLIESQLRAPSTAEFSTYVPGKTTTGAKLLTKGRWLASGTVDAQNGFGAKLRHKWFVLTDADESVLFVALGDQTTGRVPDDIQALATDTPPKQSAAPQPEPRRTWTFMPQTGRWVEHDSNVTAMQSLGGG